MSDREPRPHLIPQMDPGAFYRQHRDDVDRAVGRVLASGRYILGEECAAFELEFAQSLALGSAIGVASGTDALELALRALGIGAGDPVATVSHTAVATVAAIESAGAIPIFVDVEPSTLTMDPKEFARTVERYPGIRAVVVVHLYGQPADLASIMDIAERHGISVVEDCAQAHGARIGARPVGSFGHAAAFSFYPTKNLGAFGDGGIAATRDEAVAERLRMLRQYGWKQRFISETPGKNSRLDEMQAAILRLRLQALEAGNQRRRAIAAAYSNGLAGLGLELPAEVPGSCPVFHQYVVRHADRDRLMAGLKQCGIACNIHYPVPIHLQPAYRGRFRSGPSHLFATEDAARRVLSLPMYPELADDSVAIVIEALRTLLEGRS